MERREWSEGGEEGDQNLQSVSIGCWLDANLVLAATMLIRIPMSKTRDENIIVESIRRFCCCYISCLLFRFQGKSVFFFFKDLCEFVG